MLVFLYLMLSSAGIWLYKIGSNDNYISLKNSCLNLRFNITSVFGIIFYIFSFLIWMYIISKNDITKIYPIITSLSILIITSIGFFLGETITLQKIVGIVLIILGIILVNII